jgi:hypothetical protein
LAAATGRRFGILCDFSAGSVWFGRFVALNCVRAPKTSGNNGQMAGFRSNIPLDKDGDVIVECISIFDFN